MRHISSHKILPMKKKLLSGILLIPVSSILIAISSCKSKAQKDAQDYMDKINKTVKENSPPNTDDQQKTNAKLIPVPQDMRNIVGEWELVKFFPDHNGNHKVDQEEEKDASAGMQDYLKLNANGTCAYTIAKFEGSYEIITKDDGRKRLTIYDRSGSETTSGRYILSVTDNELLINRIALGGSHFEVFKRL